MTEPAHPSGTSPSHRIAALAALLATLGVMLATHGAPVPPGVGYDDAIYLDLARSLIAGEGYRHGSLPGAPPGVHYPPLYPLWLALWTSVGSWSSDAGAWLSLGNVVLSALAAAVWASWGVRVLALRPWTAAVVASTSMLVFPARMLAALAFSEPLSWLLLGMAAVAAAVAAAAPGGWQRSLIAGLLPMVRTILLPFSLALAVAEARAPGAPARRRAIAIALAAGPAAAWMLWSGTRAGELPRPWVGSYGTYSQMYAGSGFGVRDVLTIVGLQTGTLLGMAADMFTVTGAIVVLVCLTTGMLRLRRMQPWLAWGMIGYLALVLVWPFTPERFIWGLLPLLALVTAAGASALVARAWVRPVWRHATIALLLVPSVAYGRATVRAYETRAWLSPLRQIAERNAALVRWGRALSRPVPVATETDGLFALSTGVQSFPVVTPDPADKLGRGAPLAARVERSLCAVGSGYVALTTLDSDVAEAVRALARDSSARVTLDPPERVGGGAVVARFACRR